MKKSPFFMKSGIALALWIGCTLFSLSVPCRADDVKQTHFASASDESESDEYAGAGAVGSPVIGSAASQGYKLNIGPMATRNISPTTTIISPNQGLPIQDETPTLRWSYFDAESDPQRMFQIQISKDNFQTIAYDSGFISSGGFSYTTPILSKNEPATVYRWRVRTHDGYDLSGWVAANNGFRVSGEVFDIAVLDARQWATGPSIMPERWQTDNDPYFWWEPPSEGKGVAGYSYAIDELPDDIVDITATSIQLDEDALLDGRHTFYVAASNTAGNWGSPAAFSLWVDTVPPSVVAFGPAEGRIIDNDKPRIFVRVYDVNSGEDGETATLKINGSSVEFEYNQDAHEFSFVPTTPLREGENAVSFSIRDYVGNEIIPFIWGFIVDTEGPAGSVVINDGDEMTTSVYVRLTIRADDFTSAVTAMSISNDGIFDTERWEALAPYKDDWMLEPTSGVKKVWIKFRDSAGNESESVFDAILLVIKAPDTYITSGPSGSVSTGTAHFTFAASKEGCLFSWSFDDEAWSDWQGVQDATKDSLEEGNHYFRVRAAVDVNGNTIIDPDEIDPVPASRTWVVGTQAPEVAPQEGEIKIWKIE